MNTRELQRALVANGYSVGRAGADGDFGPDTLKALRSYQKANGLPLGAVAPAATIERLQASGFAERRMTDIGRAALKSREAVRLTAYLDSVGVWTIGVGHTAAAGEPIPRKGLTITAAEADAIFARDLAQYERAVREAVTVPLADHQFDALASICFNVGPAGLRGSTFVKRINAGASAAQIRQAILMWNKPAEIISRRTAEADQFATPYSVALPKARSTDTARVKV